MRIAHVGNYRPESANGVDKLVAGSVARLPCYGVQAEIWHFTTTLNHMREYDIVGIKVFDLPTYRRPLNFLRDLSQEVHLFVQRRQQVIDLVHFHSVFIPEHVWLAAHLRVPYILTPNGGYSLKLLQGRHRWFKTTWLRLCERTYIQQAALLQAVGPLEYEDLARQFTGSTVVYVPNAIDPPQRPGGGVDFPKMTPKNFLFLGRLAVDQKGLDLLLQGYASFLRRTGDRDTQLILAGPDFRRGKEALVKLSALLGLGSRVRFTGPVFGEGKWRLLRSAYALVHPSRWEGMPFAVLEALAVGCPVLITPETNLGEVVKTYAAGVVVDGHPEGIAEGLHLLTTVSPAVYAAARRGARQIIEDHYTLTQVVGQMAHIYQEVIDNQARGVVRR